MNKPTVALVGALLLMAASTLNGRERLTMRVSPAVALAPGFLTVRVTVDADPENRWLQIVAESQDFYRSSQIPLDGEHAPRLNVFELQSLPTGLYQVTGVLVGAHGQRATTQRLAKVQPSVGSPR